MRRDFLRDASRGTIGTVLDEGCMSTSTGAFGLPARKRRNSRQARFSGFAGTAAVAALVIGSGWTVYSNILGASVYPSMHASVEAPVAQRQMSSIVRKTPAAVITTVFGDLPQTTAAVRNSETVAAVPSIMFNERFAAATADGVAPAQVEGVRLASASPSIEVSLPPESAKSRARPLPCRSRWQHRRQNPRR